MHYCHTWRLFFTPPHTPSLSLIRVSPFIAWYKTVSSMVPGPGFTLESSGKLIKPSCPCSTLGELNKNCTGEVLALMFLESSPDDPNVSQTENLWCLSGRFRKARTTWAEGYHDSLQRCPWGVEMGFSNPARSYLILLGRHISKTTVPCPEWGLRTHKAFSSDFWSWVCLLLRVVAVLGTVLSRTLTGGTRNLSLPHTTGAT